MQNIIDVVLLQDIMSLPKETLQEIATDLNIPTNRSSREIAVSIWQHVGQDATRRNTALNNIRHKVLSGKTSVTWYRLGEGQTLTGARHTLIESCGFDPLEQTVIPPADDLTNAPIIIGGAAGENDHEYYLRFMYKSGVTQLFHGTQLNEVPNSDVKTIYINEQTNCIEVRTDAGKASKFARVLAELLRQQISMTQTDILAPFGNNIEGIADALDGELIDATAKPELLLESLNENQAEAIINILSALDEYFEEGNINQLSQDLQASRQTFGNDLVSIPFSALVLSGLEKIGMGGSATDLRRCSPLYNLFRPHVQNQGGFIRFYITEDCIVNSYTIRVGLNTKSVYFMTPASEAAVRYVRDRLIF